MFGKRFFYVCAGLFLLALSYHLGAGRASAQSGAAPDVAVLAGTVSDGGTIPLPHYADGSEALESECRWIVSVNTATASIGPLYGFVCYTTGRVVTVLAGGSGSITAVANYLIIATRVTGPVSAQQHTLGQLKARFREAQPSTNLD